MGLVQLARTGPHSSPRPTGALGAVAPGLLGMPQPHKAFASIALLRALNVHNILLLLPFNQPHLAVKASHPPLLLSCACPSDDRHRGHHCASQGCHQAGGSNPGRMAGPVPWHGARLLVGAHGRGAGCGGDIPASRHCSQRSSKRQCRQWDWWRGGQGGGCRWRAVDRWLGRRRLAGACTKHLRSSPAWRVLMHKIVCPCVLALHSVHSTFNMLACSTWCDDQAAMPGYRGWS